MSHDVVCWAVSSQSSGPVVFYISGHGLGHATRAIEVLRALATRDPAAPPRVVVRTSAPRWLFDLTAPPGN